MGETTSRQSGGVKVRPMILADLPAVLTVENASFQTPWSLAAFFTELQENDLARYLVLEVDGTVAGYGGMWIILDEAHITNIAIAPEYRRKGLGTLLVDSMLATARRGGAVRVTLEVRVSNHEARRLYERFGFAPRGVRPGYYTDTQEDAIIMWRDEEEQQG